MTTDNTICAGCGTNLSDADAGVVGESGLYNPEGPRILLCATCSLGEKSLMDEAGTHHMPNLLASYKRALKAARQGEQS